MKTKRFLSTFCAVLTALLLAGCGVPMGGGGSDSGTDPGTPTYVPTGGVTDLTDRSVSSLHLSISPEYNAADNRIDIYADVTDQYGVLFPNLNPYNFVVQVTDGPSVFPVSMANAFFFSTVSIEDKVVALALDSSGSMWPESQGGVYPDDQPPYPIDSLKNGAKLFVNQMSGTDKSLVVEFSTDARLLQGLTDDKLALEDAIDALAGKGSTNIGGAIVESVRDLGSRPGKRAIVLLTDGEDNGGRVEEGIQAAKDADIPVFTAGFGSLFTISAGTTVSTARTILEHIAQETGGDFTAVPDAATLDGFFQSQVASKVGALSSKQTHLLTIPNTLPTGGTKRIRVTVFYRNALGMHTAQSEGQFILP